MSNEYETSGHGYASVDDSTTGQNIQKDLNKNLQDYTDQQPHYSLQPCPSCGRCPTCGRGGYGTGPYWQPYSPYITCTYGNAGNTG